MAEHFTQGQALQKYNSDLSRFIDNIRCNRDGLHDEVVKDEEEKALIEQEIQTLNERLTQLSDALLKKYEAREDFDRTIVDTE